MEKTVVALYDDLMTAQKAVEKLVSAGFNRQNISLLANDASSEYAKYLNAPATTTKVDAVNAGQGASFGAIAGALMGALVGLGALAIPGIGPVIAAGPLATAVGVLGSAALGAGAGAVTGGITAALVKTGVSEVDAPYYVEGIRRGGTLLIVHTDDVQTRAAQDIINSYKPVDIQTRAANWKKNNWTGYDPNAKAYTAQEINNFRSNKY
jgi:hypothetical protein